MVCEKQEKKEEIPNNQIIYARYQQKNYFRKKFFNLCRKREKHVKNL
jgi:hypothetical protein